MICWRNQVFFFVTCPKFGLLSIINCHTYNKKLSVKYTENLAKNHVLPYYLLRILKMIYVLTNGVFISLTYILITSDSYIYIYGKVLSYELKRKL